MDTPTQTRPGPLRRIGLFTCALGWHRRPFELEPRPSTVTPEEYQFNPRYRCRRCGLVGRIDSHDNLEPVVESRFAGTTEA